MDVMLEMIRQTPVVRVLMILLDIGVVAILFYYIILAIRGTRTVHILTGLAFLLLILIVSRQIGLQAVNWLTTNFFSSIVIIMVILFQNDIRAALSAVSTRRLFGLQAKTGVPLLIEELIESARWCANRKIGMLVVVERQIGLRNYISLGTPVDAALSSELLSSIFVPTSPIHDGAVMIQKGRITTAGCFLPLSTDPEIDKRLGTRHRAAVGITEETDAVVVVVSEESGAISLVSGGHIAYNLDVDVLEERLEKVLRSKKASAPTGDEDEPEVTESQKIKAVE